jgi:hypothetical protein
MTERQRCGWCIAGDHEHCVVVVEMWRCGCWCRDPDGPADGYATES